MRSAAAIRAYRIQRVYWSRVAAVGCALVASAWLAPLGDEQPASPEPREPAQTAAVVQSEPPALDRAAVVRAATAAIGETGVELVDVELGPEGLIRLSCSGNTSLRSIARFRESLRSGPLGESRRVRSDKVSFYEHDPVCSQHDSAGYITQFEIDVAPAETLAEVAPRTPPRLACCAR